MVAFSGGNAESHALLAECLHALREDGEAVTEYEKALATRPDDPTFTHGLSAARHALATDSQARARRARASLGEFDDDLRAAPAEAPPGAPSEAPPPPSD